MTSKKSVLSAEAPPGLKALIEHCHSVYPDQPNPLQVTTVVKYWLGGQDPLDYISMYYNKGDSDKEIPPHWHYISFGLSDLHGDGRVHVRDSEDEEDFVRSGMGFELTFRLLANPNNSASESIQRPPTWPANLLQDICRYCFQSGNGLCAGDNIPWRKSLDTSKSRIENILIADDPQLNALTTPFGTVNFCQIVGVTEEEIEYASRWNGKGVLNFLKKYSQTGGEWLITDMKRDYSIFELFPQTLVSLQDDLEKQGSDLAGINAHFTYRETLKSPIKQEIDSGNSDDPDTDNDNNIRRKETLVKDEEYDNISTCMSTSLRESCPIANQPKELNCIVLDGIEITLAPYAAKFLLLAIKDRIRHGRHFTFKSQNTALTFVAESVTGAVVTKNEPYGVIGYWVQIMIDEDLVPRMMEAFRDLSNDTKITEPIEFDWPDKSLKIIIANPLTSSLKYTTFRDYNKF